MVEENEHLIRDSAARGSEPAFVSDLFIEAQALFVERSGLFEGARVEGDVGKMS